MAYSDQGKGSGYCCAGYAAFGYHHCQGPIGNIYQRFGIAAAFVVAENERAMIRARQAEGIEAARRRGVKFGRPRREKRLYICDFSRGGLDVNR